MWDDFLRIFEEEGATNVIWAMEFSANMKAKKNFAYAAKIWPNSDKIKWLFLNVVQSNKASNANLGDCGNMLDQIYNKLIADSMFNNINWGLIWSTTSLYGKKAISESDRQHCINGIKDALESGDYDMIKAALYDGKDN